VPASLARRRREVLVHVEERGARDVTIEIELAAATRVAELPATVDELVEHAAIVTPRALGGVSDLNGKEEVMKPIRIAVLVLLGAGVVALVAIGRPEPAGGADKPTAGITVTGTGSVKTVPDEAEFFLGVQTDGESAREALAANSEQMRRVLAAVRAAGVAKADVKTQDVSVSPDYSGDGHENGYTARNSVSVVIHHLARAGAVLDAAAKAGANEVYGPTLSRSDREELQAKALRSAVENARAKAEALADAGDVRLGGVTAISEGFDAGPGPVYADASVLRADKAAPIEPGTEDVQATVTVTFAIG
jgi:hypothetical protein